jgi:hypothetical protein
MIEEVDDEKTAIDDQHENQTKNERKMNQIWMKNERKMNRKWTKMLYKIAMEN